MERHYRRLCKQKEIEDRCLTEAEWLIDHPRLSIRKLAKEFNMSKSQVHRDLHSLRNTNDDLYVQCMNILKRHSAVRRVD